MRGNYINLCGFQSCTTVIDKALGFASTVKDDQKPVLLEIEWRGRTSAFRMDLKDYTVMPQEKEILL